MIIVLILDAFEPDMAYGRSLEVPKMGRCQQGLVSHNVLDQRPLSLEIVAYKQGFFLKESGQILECKAGIICVTKEFLLG